MNGSKTNSLTENKNSHQVTNVMIKMEYSAFEKNMVTINKIDDVTFILQKKYKTGQ